jgi:ketosteroid isomerase-like protein
MMSEESTTPDPVALTRTFYERMHRDWDLDALAGFFAPDAVWDLADVGLVNCEGWAAIREFLETWWANWEDHHHKIEEILDLGRGGVFVVHWEDGRPIGSKGRVNARRGNLFGWAQGRIVQITSYTDIDKARAAAKRLAESRG